MIHRFMHSLARAVLALSLAVSSASASDKVVTIGQIVDLTGPDGSIGRDYVAGIKTCFDMVNASGGINGKRIRFIVRDDRGQAELAAKAVAELVDNDRIDYLFGGVGDDTTRAVIDSSAFRRSGKTLFAPLANAEFDDSNRVLFWRPAYRQELRHLFAHFSKLGIGTVGIAYQDTPSNKEAHRAVLSEARERQIQVLATVRIDAAGDSLAQDADQLASKRPGFVLVLADTIGTALFLKEYRKRDAQRFVAGTSLVNLDTLRELAGEKATEWTVFSQVVPSPNGGRSMVQIEHLNMMRKFRDEAVSAMTLEGFAAAKTLVIALRQAKPASRAGLPELLGQSRGIDIGGMLLTATRDSNRLSSYVDIALFRKGSSLVF